MVRLARRSKSHGRLENPNKMLQPGFKIRGSLNNYLTNLRPEGKDGNQLTKSKTLARSEYFMEEKSYQEVMQHRKKVLSKKFLGCFNLRHSQYGIGAKSKRSKSGFLTVKPDSYGFKRKSKSKKIKIKRNKDSSVDTNSMFFTHQHHKRRKNLNKVSYIGSNRNSDLQVDNYTKNDEDDYDKEGEGDEEEEEDEFNDRIVEPEQLAKCISYTNKELMDKKRRQFERMREPSEIDPFFKKKIKMSLQEKSNHQNGQSMTIKTVKQIKGSAIVREYLHELDNCEFSSLKKYLNHKKKVGIFPEHNNVFRTKTKRKEKKDLILEGIREFQIDISKDKVNLTKMALARTRKKSKKKQEDQKNEDRANFTAKLRWKKIRNVRRVYKIKNNIL